MDQLKERHLYVLDTSSHKGPRGVGGGTGYINKTKVTTEEETYWTPVTRKGPKMRFNRNEKKI